MSTAPTVTWLSFTPSVEQTAGNPPKRCGDRADRRYPQPRGNMPRSASMTYAPSPNRYASMPYRRCGRSGLQLPAISLGLWQNLVVCVAILVVGMPAFAAGWLGGGDVKLLAALGLWLNLQSALGFVAAVFIAGGVVAIIYIATRPLRRGRQKDRSSGRVPYGLAIVGGAVFVFGMQLNQRPADPLANFRASHPAMW